MYDSKYKPRDRVRVIDTRRLHHGMVGRVRAVFGDHAVIVDFEGEGNGCGGFADYELEVVSEDR